MSESPPPFSVKASAGLAAWLATSELSLVFTTYQAGKLFFVGTNAKGQLSIFERSFPRCMGVSVRDNSLWLATSYQLWRFENALRPGEMHGPYDRVYVPQIAYTTGNVDTHDVAIDREGEPVFVATAFNCLATSSPTHSFRPLWKPPWITALVGEDRCHLNGLAMKHGRPAYVTSVARSDRADGWREGRSGGGVVVGVDDDAILCEGLSMPHSPRVRGDELWLLDAGSGWLGRVDQKQKAFERLAFCPGFARGLALHGDFAVVGISAAREDRNFKGLEFGEALDAQGIDAECGLRVIDLRSGETLHWMRLEGVVRELYDVAVLPGARNPMAIGLQTDEIERVISIDHG